MPQVSKRYGVDLTKRQREMISARVYRRIGAFAKQIGVNDVWLGRVLAGKLRPSRESLEKICDALDLEVSVLQILEIKPNGAPKKWGMERKGARVERRGMVMGGSGEEEDGQEGGAAPDWVI